MDKVKRTRAIQRAGFTKALNAFNDTLGATSDNKATRVAFQMLELKMKDLEETDNQIRDLMFESTDATDEMIEQECKEVDVYKNKFLGARIDMEEFSSALYDAPVISVPSEYSENKKSLKLPRIELRKFDGCVREWLPFWSVFRKIHDDKAIVNEDKFQYLLQAMVPNSRADELVRSFPPTDSNYDKAIAGLRNRFGRENLQIKVYVREFLQLMLHNALSRGKNVEISSLYDKIESHLRALESLGVTTDKCAAMLVPLVESSLPEDLLRVWQRSPLNTLSQQDTAESDDSKTESIQLIKFLEGEVSNEMRITMAVEGFSFATGDKTECGKQKREKSHTPKDVPTATGLLTTKSRIKMCLFCATSEHESAVCEQAKRMSLPERQNFAKQKNACFNCLNIGHSFKKCRLNLKCAWCSRRHVLLMCPFVQKAQTVNDNVAKVAEEKISRMWQVIPKFT
ncbi:uncharacterized protein LOC143214167 [Lasioglossum baleicum]|uniref:uncharacterized protein LOC143214167 n=1 Tax=Lasioglossum baleicum TaxID=434251 RepID=UPI003FCD5063